MNKYFLIIEVNGIEHNLNVEHIVRIQRNEDNSAEIVMVDKSNFRVLDYDRLFELLESEDHANNTFLVYE
jgi:hypothetical protein